MTSRLKKPALRCESEQGAQRSSTQTGWGFVFDEEAAMTYQGERARAMASEIGRVFAVSKVRIGADGHVSNAL